MSNDWDSHLKRWIAAGVLDGASADRIRVWEGEHARSQGLRWPILLALAFGAVLGHRHVAGQRRTAEDAQVDIHEDVTNDAEVSGHALGGGDLHLVTLAVAERQGMDLEAFMLGDGQGGGGIQATR